LSIGERGARYFRLLCFDLDSAGDRIGAMKKRGGILMLFLVCCMPQPDIAEEGYAPVLTTAKSQWSLLLGYGESYPGFRETRTRVRDTDLLLKYGHFLSGEKGDSWVRGRHELIIEVPVYIVTSPKPAAMTGVDFLFCWNFTSFSKRVVPYLFAGGGPLFTNLDLPNDLGSKLNGNIQAGIGAQFFLNKNIAFDFNVRYHHISNGATASPNVPLNSSKVLIGISRYW
jgi:lipid A 3-O-deacylase